VTEGQATIATGHGHPAEDKNEGNRKSGWKGGDPVGKEGKLRVRLRPAGKDRQAEHQGAKDEGAKETDEVRPYVSLPQAPEGAPRQSFLRAKSNDKVTRWRNRTWKRLVALTGGDGRD
jgi:hypothetical protein